MLFFSTVQCSGAGKEINISTEGEGRASTINCKQIAMIKTRTQVCRSIGYGLKRICNEKTTFHNPELPRVMAHFSTKSSLSSAFWTCWTQILITDSTIWSIHS